ncbi:MAG TPA: heparinase II/III family protein [Hyphomicrobiaceae bacterium]|nr:heparinase II/III family protein [Hyphomicrobiaceae bacterium]
MIRLTPSERLHLARMAMARTRRRALSRAMRTRALRWLAGPALADELLIVPPDLRTPDPSLFEELAAGQLGLGGAIVDLNGHSPFALMPPTPAWARELNGFGWLRDLRAANSDAAYVMARRLVAEWLQRNALGFPRTDSHAVIARRIISWISHAGLILEGVSPRAYEATTDSLGQQIQFLATSWRDAPAGYDRLLALTALVLADLCVAGHDRQLRRMQRLFGDELQRQILRDGGHISRNPGLPVEILLDLMPLRQCYVARGRHAPKALVEAIDRMIAFLKAMRLGDGTLARFNGMGRTEADALATVIAYDPAPEAPPPTMAQSRYVRLEHGALVLIMDVGLPPPLELAGHAHAGCLSFELSVGTSLLFANCGSPGQAHDAMRAASRATASHNTLCLADRSSSRLVRARLLEKWAGAPPIRQRGEVPYAVKTGPEGSSVRASHDGYVKDFGPRHTRQIIVSGDGQRVEGEDRLGAPSGRLRLANDLPFAIHFHLHPDTLCRIGDAPATAHIETLDGAHWLFSAEGAAVVLEQSFDYAHYSGPRLSQQIVLRGATPGESVIRWRLERMDPHPTAPPQ